MQVPICPCQGVVTTREEWIVEDSNQTVELGEDDLFESPGGTVTRELHRPDAPPPPPRYAKTLNVRRSDLDLEPIEPRGTLSRRIRKVVTRSAELVEFIEKGGVSPLKLAAASFLAGVVMTLAGVVIAL